MLYDSLKILHILSATFVLTSIVYSYHLWRSLEQHQGMDIPGRIQTQTTFVIIPFALLQLTTGFTMVSLKQSSFSHFWIGGSLISFIEAIASWLGFMYFLLLSQQVAISFESDNSQLKRYRRIQAIMLSLCALGLLSMIFFMANKTVLSQ